MSPGIKRREYDREAFVAALTEALGNWSQRRLAREVGVDQSWVVQWFKGTAPARETLLRVAEVTGTDPNALLNPAGYRPETVHPDQRLNAGLIRLSRELGRDVMVSTRDIVAARATPEEVDALLAAIRERALRDESR